MKFLHDDGETGFVWSDRDERLARAAIDGLEVAHDLASALGVAEEKGQCATCGDDGVVVRPLPIPDEEAGVIAINICADCQRERTEQTLAASQEEQTAEAADDA